MTAATAALIEELAHGFTLCLTDGDRDRVADAIKAVLDDEAADTTGDQAERTQP